MPDHDYRSLAEELGVRGRQSGDELRAGCPIHGGRDANFSLNVRTGAYNCHSSCGGGNFYKLVRQVLGISLTAALDWVAARAVDYPTPAPIAPLAPSERPQWLSTYEAATDNVLPQWWFDRGFDWGDAKAHEVRWHAAQQQLLIPYHWEGELVGTIARNMKGLPKYQNSPGLRKSEMLFGLVRPTPQAIIVCEGAADQMWLQKHGYAAVALLGLTMSAKQMLLLRDVPEVVLALDNDDPGRAGQEEIIKRWAGQREPRQLTAVRYPEGRNDIGECSQHELELMAAQRRVAV